MSTTARTEPADAARLRERMVEELRSDGTLHTDVLVEAFRRVPRHVFTPGESAEAAYEANRSLLAIQDERGRVVSTVSAAHIQAVMLEQASLAAGMRVLEIGSGGYNAALIAEVVGPTGAVTTVDIDPQVTERARACLRSAGYPQVVVQDADAEQDPADGAPFDRIIVTARTRDIPPAWVEQLAPDGRIVVPLRLRGLTRTVALDRCAPADTAVLAGGDARLCSFVPMHGHDADDGASDGAGDGAVGCVGAPGRDGRAERLVWLDGGRVEFRFDGVPVVDAELLRSALHGGSVERFSDVVFDRPDLLELWLATTHGPTAVVTAHPSAVDDGLLGASTRLGVVAVLEEGGFAYRVKRRSAGGEHFEVGVRAHGPHADTLADRVLSAARAWRSHRASTSAGLRVTVFPAHTDDDDLPPVGIGTVVDRAGARFVLDWPVG